MLPAVPPLLCIQPWQTPFTTVLFTPSSVQQPFGGPSVVNMHLLPPRCILSTAATIPSIVSTYPLFALFQATNVFVKGDGVVCVLQLDLSLPSQWDMAVACLEWHPFLDKATVTWCNPRKENHSHYHSHWSCIYSADPLFIPSTLVISSRLLSTKTCDCSLRLTKARVWH